MQAIQLKNRFCRRSPLADLTERGQTELIESIRCQLGIGSPVFMIHVLHSLARVTTQEATRISTRSGARIPGNDCQLAQLHLTQYRSAPYIAGGTDHSSCRTVRTAVVPISAAATMYAQAATHTGLYCKRRHEKQLLFFVSYMPIDPPLPCHMGWLMLGHFRSMS